MIVTLDEIHHHSTSFRKDLQSMLTTHIFDIDLKNYKPQIKVDYKNYTAGIYLIFFVDSPIQLKCFDFPVFLFENTGYIERKRYEEFIENDMMYIHEDYLIYHIPINTGSYMYKIKLDGLHFVNKYIFGYHWETFFGG